MATFVLVHGGWGGGWEWRFVADRLRVLGHGPYRVTLTGMGERGHLARPEVDLDTHIADVVGVIQSEELSDLVLVGHSYGGAVVTGVADAVPDRIRRLVYVDGFVLRDGQAVVDLTDRETAEAIRRTARETGDGWLTSVPWVGLEDELPGDVAPWYLRHVGRQPLATFEQPIRLSGAGDDLARTFIDCRRHADEPSLFGQFVDRAVAEGWDVRQLPVGHDAQVIAPDRLAELLAAAANLPVTSLTPVVAVSADRASSSS